MRAKWARQRHSPSRACAALAAGLRRRRSAVPARRADRLPGALPRVRGGGAVGRGAAARRTRRPPPRARRRTDGVTDATAGGRKIELVRGCAETGEFAVFLEEARRLVEKEHVDAIVGGNGPSIRDVARLYPTVPVRGDVLGRAGDHAAGAGGQRLPLRDRLRAEHGGARGLRLPPTSAGVARASSPETARPAGALRPPSSPSSARSGAGSRTRSTSRRLFRRRTPPQRCCVPAPTAWRCS